MNETSRRTRIAQILLWVCVINFGIYIGGTLKGMLVIVPQWSASIPESLHAWWGGEYVTALFFTQAGAGLSAGELTPLVQRWIWADRLRLIVISIGYLALLRAFSVPLVKSKEQTL